MSQQMSDNQNYDPNAVEYVGFVNGIEIVCKCMCVASPLPEGGGTYVSSRRGLHACAPVYVCAKCGA